jgi:hypothetical protein
MAKLIDNEKSKEREREREARLIPRNGFFSETNSLPQQI